MSELNKSRRPNIIFYFTDQQRADTCGCFGQPLNITPVLDELSQEGVKFNKAFSPSACMRSMPCSVPDWQVRYRNQLLP